MRAVVPPVDSQWQRAKARPSKTGATSYLDSRRAAAHADSRRVARGAADVDPVFAEGDAGERAIGARARRRGIIRVVHATTGAPLAARPSTDGRFVSGRPAETATTASRCGARTRPTKRTCRTCFAEPKIDIGMHKHIVIAATLSLSSIAGHAQSPTFRAETTAVQLPVRVLDAKGMFVTDLTAADFEVLEDGVPQTISDFTLVDLEARAKRAPTVPGDADRRALDSATREARRPDVCVSHRRLSPQRAAYAARETARAQLHQRSAWRLAMRQRSSWPAAPPGRISRTVNVRCGSPLIG